MATAKKLPSGRWRCLVYIDRDEHGKRKYKSCTTDNKKEALALASALQLNAEALLSIGGHYGKA